MRDEHNSPESRRTHWHVDNRQEIQHVFERYDVGGVAVRLETEIHCKDQQESQVRFLGDGSWWHVEGRLIPAAFFDLECGHLVTEFLLC